MNTLLKDIVSDTYTNAAGYTLYLKIKESIQLNSPLSIDCTEIGAVSSSFLNSSIGASIEEFGLDTFVKFVKFRNVSASLGQFIKEYVNTYRAQSTC